MIQSLTSCWYKLHLNIITSKKEIVGDTPNYLVEIIVDFPINSPLTGKIGAFKSLGRLELLLQFLKFEYPQLSLNYVIMPICHRVTITITEELEILNVIQILTNFKLMSSFLLAKFMIIKGNQIFHMIIWVNISCQCFFFFLYLL